MLDLEMVISRFQSVANYTRSGRVNHRWVSALPRRMAALADEWELELDGEASTDLAAGVPAVLVSCTGPLGDAVLKLAPDAYALAEEAAMLRQFAPSGRVPAVLAIGKSAVLLEAVRPGTPAEELPDLPSPTEYAPFFNELHSAGDPESAPREVSDWIELMQSAAERDGFDVTESRRIAGELLAEPPERVLLHGNLHLGNVLASDIRGLVARSPIACAGERCFDAADYVLEGSDRAAMVRLRDGLARAAGLDPDRLNAWCRVLAPLAASHATEPRRIAELLAFGRGEY